MREPDLIEQWAAAWTSRRPEALLALFCADALYEDVAQSAEHRGLEAIRAHAQANFDLIPDLQIAVGAHGVEGQSAFAEWVITGTCASNFMGRPAAGKRFSIRGVSVFEVRAGKLERCSDYWDLTSFLDQLGPQEVS